MEKNLKIKLTFVLLCLGLVIALVRCGSGSSSSSSGGMNTAAAAVEVIACPANGTTNVAIVNYAFTPASASISAGTIVEWTNSTADTTHTVTSTTVPTGGGFDNTVTPGASICLRFTTAGTYSYHCSIHPTMTASIIVAGPAIAGGSTGGGTTSGGGTSTGGTGGTTGGTGGGYTY